MERNKEEKERKEKKKREKERKEAKPSILTNPKMQKKKGEKERNELKPSKKERKMEKKEALVLERGKSEKDDEVIFLSIRRVNKKKPSLSLVNMKERKEKAKKKKPSLRRQLVEKFCAKSISYDARGKLRTRRESLKILCPNYNEALYNKVLLFHNQIEKSKFSPFSGPFHLILHIFCDYFRHRRQKISTRKSRNPRKCKGGGKALERARISSPFSV